MITTAARDALAAWLNSRPATLAVTLRYHSGPVSIDKARRDIGHLHAVIDKRIYGRHFATSPVRSSYWAIGESLDVNPHVHSGWYLHGPDHVRIFANLLAAGTWERVFARGGTHDVQPYDQTGYAPGHGWAGYACKSLTTTDHVILSLADKSDIDTIISSSL